MRFAFLLVLIVSLPVLAQKPKTPKTDPKGTGTFSKEEWVPNPVKVDATFIKEEEELLPDLRKLGEKQQYKNGITSLNPPEMGNAVYGVAFSTKGHLIATGGRNATFVREMKTGKIVADLPGITGSVAMAQMLDFSPDAKRLAVLERNYFRVYDLATQKQLFSSLTDLVPIQVAYSADGSIITTVTGNSVGAAPVTVTTFDSKTFAVKKTWSIYNARQSRFWSLSPSGNLLIHFNQQKEDALGIGNAVVTISLVDGKERIYPAKVDIQSGVVAHDDKTVYFLAWKDRNAPVDELHSLDLVSGEIKHIARWGGHSRTLMNVTPDGKMILIHGGQFANRLTTFWEIETGKTRWLTGVGWYPTIRFSPGGKYFGGSLPTFATTQLALFTLDDILEMKEPIDELAATKLRLAQVEIDISKDKTMIKGFGNAKVLNDIVNAYPNLQSLNFSFNGNPTPDDVKPLLKLTKLETLTLGSQKTDAAIIEILGGLTSLKSLNFWGQLTAKGEELSPLKKLTNLETLVLGYSLTLSEDCLKQIGGIKSLKALPLPQAPNLTEKGIEHLAGLDLREIKITQLKDGPAAVKHLSQMKNLEKLVVNYGKFDADDWASLAKLTKLRELQLSPNADLDDKNIEALKDLAELQTLVIGTQPKLTGSGFVQLEKLTKLRELRLSGSSITSENLKFLKPFTELETLSLMGTNVRDTGLEHLSGLKKLKSLELTGTPLTGSGLVHFKDCEQLYKLDLSDIKMTNEGLVGIKGYTHLRELRLPKSITDEGIAKLEGLPQLSWLDLTDCNLVKGKTLPTLKKATPRLQSLSLSRTGIENDTLSSIGTLTQLREVYLTGTKVTPEAIPTLKKFVFLGWISVPFADYKDVFELRKGLPKTTITN